MGEASEGKKRTAILRKHKYTQYNTDLFIRPSFHKLADEVFISPFLDDTNAVEHPK